MIKFWFKYRGEKMKKRKINWLVAIIVIVASLFGVNQRQIGQYVSQYNSHETSLPTKQTTVQNVADKNLSQLTFKSGSASYLEVNHNKSTLAVSSWKQDKIDYGNLDNLNRTTTAIGYLERRNLVRSDTRSAQRWQPTGWHQKTVSFGDRKIEILNRGHLLAYSVTGKIDDEGKYDENALGSIDNPKNLATQTEFSNQRTMQLFEQRVREALKADKKVIYKVTTVFKGRGLMPLGYHLQALSTDQSLNFNVFVWNVEPGVKFDYKTGRSKLDSSMKVSE